MESPDIELAVIILADGVRPDVLSRLAEAGELPHIDRSFLSRGAQL